MANEYEFRFDQGSGDCSYCGRSYDRRESHHCHRKTNSHRLAERRLHNWGNQNRRLQTELETLRGYRDQSIELNWHRWNKISSEQHISRMQSEIFRLKSIILGLNQKKEYAETKLARQESQSIPFPFGRIVVDNNALKKFLSHMNTSIVQNKVSGLSEHIRLKKLLDSLVISCSNHDFVNQLIRIYPNDVELVRIHERLKWKAV